MNVKILTLQRFTFHIVPTVPNAEQRPATVQSESDRGVPRPGGWRLDAPLSSPRLRSSTNWTSALLPIWCPSSTLIVPFCPSGPSSALLPIWCPSSTLIVPFCPSGPSSALLPIWCPSSTLIVPFCPSGPSSALPVPF
ncbi:unnamed protein product [Gadus morhua 'NCC']